MKMYGLAAMLFGIIIFVGFSVFSKKNYSPSHTQTSLTTTPVPFEQLTIPYLRQRSYKSNLNNLQQIADNGIYTSYLTSYQSDALKINGLLTKPDAKMPKNGWPAVVFVHGYIAPTIYKTLEKYVDYVDYLARNGFVVFKIDLRGHGDSEGIAGGGYYGSDYVVDTLNAYTALETADFINPDSIGLWGHSMAGNIVMRSMAAHPTIPAAVIWAGAGYTYTDLAKYGLHDDSYRPVQNITRRANSRSQIYEKVGSPSANNAFWQQVAPTFFLNDLKGAIQLHHAVDDTVVNIGYSKDLNALLDKTSVPHEFYQYSTGGHNISGSSFNQAMQRTVDFYRKYLK
jgi:dipeptidyl aminopeptidase/acylaminoacyl peptidase